MKQATIILDKESNSRVIVQIPHYRKDGPMYYKVISEKKCIRVIDSEDNAGIELQNAAWAFDETSHRTTSEVFDKYLNDAQIRIQEALK